MWFQPICRISFCVCCHWARPGNHVDMSHLQCLLSLTKHASFQKDVRITLGVRIVVPQPPILKRLLISTGLRLLPYRMGPLMLLFLGLVVFAWAPSPFCLRHIRKHQSLLICAPAPRPQKGPPEATPFFAFAREQACHLMYLTEAFCLGS